MDQQEVPISEVSLVCHIAGSIDRDNSTTDDGESGTDGGVNSEAGKPIDCPVKRAEVRRKKKRLSKERQKKRKIMR